MIYERNKTNKYPLNLEQVLVLILVITTTSFITYGVCAIHGVLGQSASKQFTYSDLLLGLANIFTAAAFIFAFFQFHSNNKEKRQRLMLDEADTQIQDMHAHIKGMNFSNCNIDMLNSFMGQMVSSGINFNELFEAMDEDIYKAMARMRWQKMYFDYLLPSLNILNITDILKNSFDVDSAALVMAEIEANTSVEKKADSIPNIYKGFHSAKELLNTSYVSNFKLDINNSTSLMFIRHYFHGDKMNNHLYGLLNIVNINAQAPVLAAMFNSEDIFDKYAKAFNKS